MTAMNQLMDVVTSLNAAEAFSLASLLETKLPKKIRLGGDVVDVKPVPAKGEHLDLPEVLLAFAARAGAAMDAQPVNEDKVRSAKTLIEGSSVTEAAQFTLVLKRNPAYRLES